jgi:hypothetical protein
MRAEIFTAIAKCSHVRTVLSNGVRWTARDASEPATDEVISALAAQHFRVAGVVGISRCGGLIAEDNDRPGDCAAVLAAALELGTEMVSDPLERLYRLEDPRPEREN